MKTTLYIFLFFLCAGSCLAQNEEILVRDYNDDGICIIPDYERCDTCPPEVYTIVDKDAEFPEGFAAMAKFIQQNLVYPEKAQKDSIVGKVFLKFVVNEDGNIGDVQVLKGVPGYPDCDKEAIRLVKSMPKWKPALVNDKPVKCYFILPIRFKP